LLGAAFADSSGIANVAVTNIKIAGKADIVATHQNRIPYFDHNFIY